MTQDETVKTDLFVHHLICIAGELKEASIISEQKAWQNPDDFPLLSRVNRKQAAQRQD